MHKIDSWIRLFVTTLLLSFKDASSLLSSFEDDGPGNGHGDMKHWDAGDLQRRGLRGRSGSGRHAQDCLGADGEPCRGQDGCTYSNGDPCGPHDGEPCEPIIVRGRERGPCIHRTNVTVEEPPVRGLLSHGSGSGRHAQDCLGADGGPCRDGGPGRNCTGTDGEPCQGRDDCTDSYGEPCGPTAEGWQRQRGPPCEPIIVRGRERGPCIHRKNVTVEEPPV
jgi:hypothetical protein